MSRHLAGEPLPNPTKNQLEKCMANDSDSQSPPASTVCSVVGGSRRGCCLQVMQQEEFVAPYNGVLAKEIRGEAALPNEARKLRTY